MDRDDRRPFQQFEEDRRQALVRALVSDPQHLTLYQESTGFRASIDVLARLLPMMVNGLALDAANRRRVRAEYIHRMTQEPGRL